MEYENELARKTALNTITGCKLGGNILNVSKAPVRVTYVVEHIKAEAIEEEKFNYSRVLVFRNVAGKEMEKQETYYQIHEEYKTMCKIYGNVVAIKIPRPIEGKKVEGSGNVYVQFESKEEAKKVFGNLRSKMAEKKVTVEYYDEQNFSNKVFQ